MKRFLLSLIFFTSFSSFAKLKIINQTCATVSFVIFCHDGIYSSCGAIQSVGYFVPPNDSKIFNNTSELSWFNPPSNGSTGYQPGAPQNWDAFKFYASDGTNTLYGSVNLCGFPGTTYDSGSQTICSTTNFYLSIGNDLGDTIVMINYS